MSHDPAGAFWSFSTSIYGLPDVAAECLLLQDQHDVDVNILLFSAYAGTNRYILAESDMTTISNLTREWHATIVKSLRFVRISLKQWSLDPQLHFSPMAHQLRNQIKRDELEAERIEHTMLADWLAAKAKSLNRVDRTAAIRQNVETVLHHYGLLHNNVHQPLSLIAAALEHRTEARN